MRDNQGFTLVELMFQLILIKLVIIIKKNLLLSLMKIIIFKIVLNFILIKMVMLIVEII